MRVFTSDIDSEEFFFLTYILGGKSEASFIRRKLVCERLSQSVNASDHSKRPQRDLKRADPRFQGEDN